MQFKYSLYARRAFVALLNATVLAGAVPLAAARQTPSSNPPTKVQPPAPASTPEEAEMNRLHDEGTQALNKADFTLAEQRFKAGLDKAQALQNKKYVSTFFSCLCSVYYNMGQFDKALDCGNSGLVVMQTLGSPAAVAVCLTNLGAVYCKLGQFEKALDCGSRALGIWEKLDFPRNTASSLLNLGNVYNALGQNDKALEYHNRALSLVEKQGDARLTANILNNLGSVHDCLGQTEEARGCYNRARSLFEAINDPSGVAYTLVNLGNLYYGLGQFQQALDHYDQSLAIRKKLADQQDIATAFTNVGAAYYGMGQYRKALDSYQQALVIKEELGSPQNTIVTLNNMGDAYVRLGRLSEAQGVFDRAVQNFEKVSLEVGDLAQVGALQNALPLYAGYAGLCLRQQQPDKALALLERGRAQGLTRQLAQSRVDYAALFSPQDAARWRDANNELNLAENVLGATENRLARAQDRAKSLDNDKNSTPQQKSDMAAEAKAAQEQQQQAKQRDEAAERQRTILRTELRQRYPQFRQMNQTQPPPPAQFADMARRHPDTLFVQWAVTDDETLALVMGQKDGIRGFRIPQTTKTLRDRALAWRDAIEAAGKLRSSPPGAEAVRCTEAAQSEPQRARDLYHVLFDPLAEAGLLAPGRYRRLVLVSDGPLLDLPLAALVTDTGSGTAGRILASPPQRLLDRYAVSNAVSFAILDQSVSNEKAGLPLFCVADTADGTMPERFGAVLPAPAFARLHDAKSGSDPLPLGLRAGHAPLRYARKEGKEVVGMFPGAVGLAGPLAREAVVRETMRRADILHFAVHNTPDPLNAMRSWLLLAPEDADSLYDGRLEAREVASMKLRARMAVLSACESGRGQQRGGDGLIGMAWAFRAAGCPCVVAAQWKVNDAASCSLMTWFYRGLLAGHSKDEAMQRAMQAVRGEEGRQSPFFWAGFEVIGSAAPLFPTASTHTAPR